MKFIDKLLLVAVTLLALGGCATGLDKNATAIDWTKGSIVVMSVELTNQYKPNYQPTALGVVMMKKSGKDPRERIPAFSRVAAGTNTFLITQQIQPGKYAISKLYGMSQKFLIMGNIDYSVDAPFEVAADSVIYLGRVTAVNKERINKDDQATGAVIPLIDQAVAGFAGGTLEVSLTDNYDVDVKNLKKEFAFLQKSDVVRAPLQKMMLERTTASSAALIEVKPTPPTSSQALALPMAMPVPLSMALPVAQTLPTPTESK